MNPFNFDIAAKEKKEKSITCSDHHVDGRTRHTTICMGDQELILQHMCVCVCVCVYNYYFGNQLVR